MAAEVLAVFKRHLVSITEFVGMDVRRWGVGICTDRISQKRVEKIMAELKDIPGVVRQAPPDEGEGPEWESSLPPRRNPLQDSLVLPAPYICGNPITEDAYFYGMPGARAELSKLYHAAVHPEMREGMMAFIRGTKRAGKTSLAKIFLRELERKAYSPRLTAYYETPISGCSWKQAEIETAVLKRRAGAGDISSPSRSPGR
jgi:hypothetical protein